MSWMISDSEADKIIKYLNELQSLKPSKNLQQFIVRFQNATNFNRGKEM